jgi:hypothetical protein
MPADWRQGPAETSLILPYLLGDLRKFGSLVVNKIISRKEQRTFQSVLAGTEFKVQTKDISISSGGNRKFKWKVVCRLADCGLCAVCSRGASGRLKVTLTEYGYCSVRLVWVWCKVGVVYVVSVQSGCCLLPVARHTPDSLTAHSKSDVL